MVFNNRGTWTLVQIYYDSSHLTHDFTTLSRCYIAIYHGPAGWMPCSMLPRNNPQGRHILPITHNSTSSPAILISAAQSKQPQGSCLIVNANGAIFASPGPLLIASCVSVIAKLLKSRAGLTSCIEPAYTCPTLPVQFSVVKTLRTRFWKGLPTVARPCVLPSKARYVTFGRIPSGVLSW